MLVASSGDQGKLKDIVSQSKGAGRSKSINNTEETYKAQRDYM